MNIQLAKYHGLGNDFLVLVDTEGGVDLGPDVVAALCDRHRGIGADGLLRLAPPRRGGAFAMELRNADGGVAETSGNGLRCAALAAVHAGLARRGDLVVETAVGDAAAHVSRDSAAGAAQVRVSMGELSVGDEIAATELLAATGSGASVVATGGAPRPAGSLGGLVARRVGVGNPHVVIYAPAVAGGAARASATPVRSLDVATVGPAIDAGTVGGVNVEVVDVVDGALSLAVWERGVGVTLACGSGSCAAAAAMRAAGLAGDRVLVVNPGGALFVELSGPPAHPSAVLSGPAQRIAAVTVDLADLDLAGFEPTASGGLAAPNVAVRT